MMMRRIVFVALIACATLAISKMPTVADEPTAKEKPIKALLITGGCCHDYAKQKEILSKGISERANVEWTIVHEGGSGTKHQVSIYKDKDWAKGYDVVVHNECFADEKNLDHIHVITEAHRAGVPAVMIHCAAHCYRGDTKDWFELVGVRSHGHGPQLPIVNKVVDEKSPILKTFPDGWTTGKEELYGVAEVYPNCHPIVEGHQGDNGKPNAIIWTNQFGQGKVFGTTLAHNNVTMEDPVFLDFVSRGLLWSVGKLGEDGKPAAGYEGTGVAAKDEKPSEGPQPTPAPAEKK